MSVLKWGNPMAFWFFLILLGYVILYFLLEKKFENILNQHFGAKVVPWLRSRVSIPKRRLKLSLQVIATSFLLIALARPQMGQSEQEVKSEGVELMILADVSDSMLSEDVKPSRLEQMKIDLSKLMDLMPGNKTGLIAFAGSAALMTPLTSDPSALKMYVQSLDTYAVSTQGTSFETALSFAKEAFEKGGVTQAQNLKTTRVIIVASDGEDQEPGALEAAKALVKDGIKIISIAYGTEKGGSIPARDQFGNLTGMKKNRSGETILTQVKGDFLKKLAEEGHGSFYFAKFNGDYLKQIVQDVNQFEKAQFDSSTVVQYDEKFFFPLAIGLVVLMMSLFINDRQNQPLQWKGRYQYE